MKFFLDTANIEEIRDVASTGILDGITTNPTLISKEGNTFEDQLLKMGQIQADFAAVTNIYRKQMGLMRLALGKNGG